MPAFAGPGRIYAKRHPDAVCAEVGLLTTLILGRGAGKVPTHGPLSIEHPHLPSTMSHNPLNASNPHLASTNSPHRIVTPVQEKQEKHKAGASWKATEQQVLPHNRFWIVFPGLMCCIFLAALDQVRSQLCLFSADRRFTHCNRPSLPLLYQPLSNVLVRVKITAGLEGTPSFFFLARFDSDLFFSAPTSLRPARSPQRTESYLISLAENPFFTLLSCHSWYVT